MWVSLVSSILVADLQNMLSLLHLASVVLAAAQLDQASSQDSSFLLRSLVW